MALVIMPFIVPFIATIDTQSIGANIVYPLSIASADSTLMTDIILAEHDYVGPSGIQRTRVFNGEMVGPTLRLKAGDTLSITLHNDLPPRRHNASHLHNTYQDFDVTNVHTHGLHVSSRPGADDVFTQVAPGTSFTYTIHIPQNHMPGTHWYHPHHHGSTNIQTGGGAVGAIVVEDPPGALPAAVAALEDKVLVLHHFNMPEQTRVARVYERNCLTHGGTAEDCQDRVFGGGATTGEQTDSVLVNGMTMPVITMAANRWYRWRLIFAAVDGTLTPALATCEVGLLAHDGVYLHRAPRPISAGYMGPGNRADWVVRCPAGTHAFVSNGLPDSEAAFNGNALEDGSAGVATVAQLLATVSAVDEGDDASCSLDTFAAARPCYLVDLTGTQGGAFVPAPEQSTIIQQGGGRGHGPGINGLPFQSSTSFQATYRVGTVNELRLKHTHTHPTHMHINHFQLVDAPDVSFGGYIQQGDWFDSLALPWADGEDGMHQCFGEQVERHLGGCARVRFQANGFTGTQVIHCHILEHEDKGMMALTEIVGTEGTTFANASLIDPTCYADAFDSDVHAPTIHAAGTCTAPTPGRPPVQGGAGDMVVQQGHSSMHPGDSDDEYLPILWIVSATTFLMLVLLASCVVYYAMHGRGSSAKLLSSKPRSNIQSSASCLASSCAATGYDMQMVNVEEGGGGERPADELSGAKLMKVTEEEGQLSTPPCASMNEISPASSAHQGVPP